MITESMRLLAPMYEQSGISKAELNSNIDLVAMLTPIQWSFLFMMQNILIGFITSLPIAAVCMRKVRSGN